MSIINDCPIPSSMGLFKAIGTSKKKVAFRWIIVDNSRSMLTRDGLKIVEQEQGFVVVPCTRWDEVTISVNAIARLATCGETPTEIRLLNNKTTAPIVVGQSHDNQLSAVVSLLSSKPNGLTPICMQLCEVAEQLRCLSPMLKDNDRIALIIIMTDGESTDGDIVDILKPLEGLPLQVIIRVCTLEQTVIDYWQNINAQLDIDIHVLQSINTEASASYDNNPWLAYTDTLQHAREFGLGIPEIDALTKRQLTRREIHKLAKLLLAEEDATMLPEDPDKDWTSFLAAVNQAQEEREMVYCIHSQEKRPYFDIQFLRTYVQNPMTAIIAQNEDVLWDIYIFYSFNAAIVRKTEELLRDRGIDRRQHMKLQPAPVFRSNAKYEKRLLCQDDLWQLFNDFGLVPQTIDASRFDKLMVAMGTKRHSLNGKINKGYGQRIKLCFREFVRIMLQVSHAAYPTLTPASTRLVALLTLMQSSGNLAQLNRLNATLDSSPITSDLNSAHSNTTLSDSSDAHESTSTSTAVATGTPSVHHTVDSSSIPSGQDVPSRIGLDPVSRLESASCEGKVQSTPHTSPTKVIRTFDLTSPIETIQFTPTTPLRPSSGEKMMDTNKAIPTGVDGFIGRNLSIDLPVGIGTCVGYLPSHPSSPLTYVAAAVPISPTRSGNHTPSNTHSRSPSSTQPHANNSMHPDHTSPMFSTTHPSTPTSTTPPRTLLPPPPFPLLPPSFVDVSIPVVDPHRIIRTPGTGGKYIGDMRYAEDNSNTGDDGVNHQPSSSLLPPLQSSLPQSSLPSPSSLPYKITDLRSIPPYIHHVYATPTPQSQPNIGLEPAHRSMVNDAEGRGTVDVMDTWKIIMTPIRSVAERHTETARRNDDINPSNNQGNGQGSEQGLKQEKPCAEPDVMTRFLGAFGGDWLSISK